MTKVLIRKLLIIGTLLAGAICASLRIYHAYVPWGAKPIPYLAASVDGGTIESPNGVMYEIWFNDAGAMHSGAHWTWVVKDHWLYGKSVVVEGYLGPDFAVDKVPTSITWDEDMPVIEFLPSRY